MKNIILIPGSWHTAEAWYKVKTKLLGYNVYNPGLTGMTNKDQPGGPEINVSTHVDDIVDLIVNNNLDEVVLVGHSYSGLVISGVAEKLGPKISKLIFTDAFIPDNNQSLFDIMGADKTASMKEGLVDAKGRTLAQGAQSAWLLPSGDAEFFLEGEGCTQELIDWLNQRLVLTPVGTFEEGLSLNIAKIRSIPSFYIQCTGFPYLSWVADKAKSLGWPVYQINSGHDVMLTNDDELSRIITDIVG